MEEMARKVYEPSGMNTGETHILSKIPKEKKNYGARRNVPGSNHSTHRFFVPPHLPIIHDARFSSHENTRRVRERRRVGIRRVWSGEGPLRIPSPTSRTLSISLDNRLEPFPIH